MENGQGEERTIYDDSLLRIFIRSGMLVFGFVVFAYSVFLWFAADQFMEGLETGTCSWRPVERTDGSEASSMGERLVSDL